MGFFHYEAYSGFIGLYTGIFMEFAGWGFRIFGSSGYGFCFGVEAWESGFVGTVMDRLTLLVTLNLDFKTGGSEEG